MRLFVAADLPADLRAARGVAARGAQPANEVRWVRPEGIHLTFVFLGEVAAERLATIQGALEASAAEAPAPFRLRAAGIGAFPDRGPLRVVWVGIEGDGAAARLRHVLEMHLARCGFVAGERAFRPHLILGRVRQERGREDRVLLEGYRSMRPGSSGRRGDPVREPSRTAGRPICGAGPLSARARGMTTAVCGLLGFALGSIPFSWILGRLGGLDIRRVGSRNIGATNLSRSLGYRVGLVAFVLDAAKGAAAVLLARRFAPGVESAPLWAGGMAVAGHMFTPFLRFRGGKGVATGAGVFAVLAPVSLLFAVAVFGLTLAFGRMVSLASVLASMALPLAQLALGAGTGTVVLASLVGALVIARHRPNLARILQGTENRIGGGGQR